MNTATNIDTPAANAADTRKRRKARQIVAGVVAGAVTIGGIAFAIFLGNAQIQGSTQGGQFKPEWQAGTLIATDSATAAPSARCTGSITDGVLTLNTAGLLPGETCSYSATVSLSADSTASGYITGLDMVVPEGINAFLPPMYCGAEVHPADEQPPTTVGVIVMATPTMPLGGAAQPMDATDGVKIAPLGSNAPLTCSQ